MNSATGNGSISSWSRFDAMFKRKLNLWLFGLVLLAAVAGGLARSILVRRQEALKSYLHVTELGKKGLWKEAFQLTHPQYRRFANVVNLEGDFKEIITDTNKFTDGFKIGGWDIVEIRQEFRNQPNWGVFVTLKQENGVWLIYSQGTWSIGD